MKKKLLTLITIAVLIPTISALAATHSNGPKWVRNTENWHQLSYFGEAYTRLGRGPSKILYYRNGQYIGGAIAAVVTIGPNEDYKNVTIWDSLNPWAPKTEYTYYL